MSRELSKIIRAFTRSMTKFQFLPKMTERNVKRVTSKAGASSRNSSKYGLRCCVLGCENSTTNSPELEFYSFPANSSKLLYKAEKRRKWLEALKLRNSDGSPWEPTPNSRICSEHFLGNKKSDDPRSPSYIPMIFPKPYMKAAVHKNALIHRYKFLLKRNNISKVQERTADNDFNKKKQQLCNSSVPVTVPDDFTSENSVVQKVITKVDKAIQVDFSIDFNEQEMFICTLFRSQTCEAQTQALGLRGHAPIVKKESYTEGFHGFQNIKNEEEIKDLAGVSFEVFKLLLKMLSSEQSNDSQKISFEDQLFLFLLIMKNGLTFKAVGALFNINETTASKIFYRTLQYLAVKCKNFVFWPTTEVVQKTMPEIFKENYGNTRVIIDCLEFQIEQPTTIAHLVQCYSHKKGFSIKMLVGCTPSGFISILSKCYGGSVTDAQIIVFSGLLNLLESGDIVLANKDFSQIMTVLDNSGKNILLIMPPFMNNQNFSEKEFLERFEVAKVRIHIDRLLQRIKTYKICSKLTVDMLPYSDDILFMCSVLVNLQAPVINKNSD